MNRTFDNNKAFPGMDDYSVRIGLHYNGWIYYANPLMGKCLYRVRENGTDNTQLTDYSVTGVFKVKSGKLILIDDINLDTHEISLV